METFKITGLCGTWAVTEGPPSIQDGQTFVVSVEKEVVVEESVAIARVKKSWVTLGHALKSYDEDGVEGRYR